ncbi:uncharacterized protein LOC132205229 [Neocloeon triangulifer]|uniref:uncharacterized protein LOC132205229 n=1 Tax=Neocloeon triangulifer TaxID=2078957 RepID=UPI00286F78FE|nr:uncharacterized protein LOC132205229 [Neocloeon triangulifer]
MTMLRAACGAVLFLALASATPLWLRPELPLNAHLNPNPRALADYLLPTDVTPSAYEVHLIPFLKDDIPTGEAEFTFRGTVIITVTCNTATNKIVLHALDVEFVKEDITVTKIATPATPVSVTNRVFSSDDKHFLTINLAANLEVGAQYTIEIKYLGHLNTVLEGFYRSSYVDEGVTKWMGVTQFESNGARRAFPSFDEPGLKATFKIKVARFPSYTVLGNMPIANTEEDVTEYPGAGLKWTEFENSEIMSTYLVAFSVNQFENLGEVTDVDNIKYDVWSRPNAIAFGAYANEIAPQSVAFMKAFTGRKYDLPKIDQIAVPDFAAGAMENWGLITYRETALLYDSATGSSSNKQRVAAVVTHELAHQWFGDIVSPKWWNNLWLNEGFATYFEYFATNSVENDWKMDEQFIYEQLQSALIFDAKTSTHAIVPEGVDSPSAIDSMFDDISYNKGGCIVRLLINLMGEDNFKTGINKYLNDNAFGNADADNLWTALQTAVPPGALPEGLTLKNVMDTWTLQGGFPAIRFERLYDADQRATIQQERFLSERVEELPTEQWIVPLTWTNKAEEGGFDNLAVDQWLTTPNTIVSYVGADDDWVILNLQQYGFYRVNYDERNWNLLARAINSSESLNSLHVINRAQLMDDALALARTNNVSYTIALDTTNYLDFETEYLPWATAFEALSYVIDRLNSEDDPRNQFETYMRNRLRNTYNRLGGFEIPIDEGHVQSLTRALVLSWACKLKSTECNDAAKMKFQEWKTTEDPDNNNPINPNLKSVVYCTGARTGVRNDALFLFERYEGAFADAAEQSRILSSIGCSSDASVLSEFMAEVLKDNPRIRTQDTRTVITAVYNNPIGVDLALDFVLANYQKINDNMGGFSSIGRIFSGIAGKLNTVEQRDKLKNFLEQNPGGVISDGTRPAIEGAIKTVEESILWHEEHKSSVVQYLREKNSAPWAVISPLLILVASFVTKDFKNSFKMGTARIALLAAFFSSLANASPLITKRALADYLLPTDVIPWHYDISLIPFLDDNVPVGEQNFTFKGYVKIIASCKTAGLTQITLHAHSEIAIASLDSIKVQSEDAIPTAVPVQSFARTGDDRNFLTINLGRGLQLKNYSVEIVYSGVLNNELNGFYRSSYVEGSETKWLAVTQFESTGARRAFPCFDEPALKATFKIKIARSVGYTINGNMPIEREDEDLVEYPGMKWTEFAVTQVRMTTYTVAFTVNKFASLDGGTVGTPPVQYSTWARPNSVQFGAYSNEITPKVIQYITDFTGHPYTLPKIDQIAVPDFPVGAQENWGLVTYKETALLYDENTASTANKQRVGAVIAHEIAHQWFGNLVSPKWWNSIWLNEGFGVYLEYFAANAVEILNDWKMDQQFIYEEMQPAFVSDAQESTHPLVNDVDSPSTIDAMFDNISYNKGGCIVRFLLNLMGEDNFKRGLKTYFDDRYEGSADSDDLWSALQPEVPAGLFPSGQSLKEVMETWTLQPGFPVVSFQRLYDTERRAIITQERFLALPSGTIPIQEWIVPLTWTNGVENDFLSLSPDEWLIAQNMTVNNIATNNDWIVANLQQTGFYRVNYDEQNWHLLALALNTSDGFGTFNVFNRAQLMDDALALARAKYVSYPKALDITNYLVYETEYLPWATSFKSLEYIYDRLNHEDEPRSQFEMYMLDRLQNTYERLGGFNIPEGGDSHTQSLTRALILDWACRLKQGPCNLAAADQFKLWQSTLNPDKDNPINPNLKSVVYCSGVRTGDRQDALFLIARYEAAFENAAEQARIITALGCSSDVTLLQDYLQLSIQAGPPIRPQDTKDVITAVYNNPIGVDLALDFILANYEAVSNNMGVLSNIGRAFSGISVKLNTVEQRDKLQYFLDNNGGLVSPGVIPSIEGAIRTAEESIKWHGDHKKVVVDYFRAINGSKRLRFEMKMHRLSALLCLLAVANFANGTPLWARPPEDEYRPVKHRALGDYKLPESVIPSRYEIHLIPYMEETLPPKNFTFDGQVRIQVTAKEATNMIRMHANDMTVMKETVVVTNDDTGDAVLVNDVTMTEPIADDRHFLDILLGSELEVDGNYTIEISFVGKLNDDLEGFYRSNYFEDGVEKWMLATQFEQTAARRAFPCFDEPALKAVFQLNVARQPTWIVLSNMPTLNETPVNETGLEDWIWVHFEPSVVMSPYLLAFTVARFGSITSPLDSRFKVWARPSYVRAGEYANLVAPKVVTYMEDFTKQIYPLPKMDEIAIPDFSAGAMENWGLITYRETALLFNKDILTTSSQQGTASVVAHELAHQWFGNLVSPKWWSNTWLNEGFATFFAAYSASHVETEWLLDEQFVTGDVNTALSADALETAHPLVDPSVDSPSAASAIFDSISYSKGGSVIRMVLNFMGEDNFKKGIAAYLEDMQYTSADQDDLWRGLEQGVPAGLLPEGVAFKDIMDSWAIQAGYPVVTVTRDYENNTASFVQKRFISPPTENEHNEVYWVPLTMIAQDQPENNDITWLSDAEISLDVPAADKWILVNNQKNGYYRVNYDKQNWKMLSEAINSTGSLDTLSVLNRAQLIMDSFVLAKAKHLDYESAFDTTNYLTFEKELTPWNAALNELSYLNDRMVADDSSKSLFQRYLSSRMEHLYEHVNGFNQTDADKHVLRLQRGTVLSWLCSIGNDRCNQDGFELFSQWKNENKTIIPDLKNVVYKSGMRKGGQAEYDFLYTKYLKAEWSTEISLIISALGASNDEAILLRLLRDSIAENSPFKTSDARAILSAVQGNPSGTNLALDFIIDNFFNAKKQWGDSGSVFTSIAGRLNTDSHKQKLTNFLNSNQDNLTDSAKNNLNRALATVEQHLQWNKDHKQTILSYLARKIGNSAPFLLVSNALLVAAIVLAKLL